MIGDIAVFYLGWGREGCVFWYFGVFVFWGGDKKRARFTIGQNGHLKPIERE